jgi:hypothetical protein
MKAMKKFIIPALAIMAMFTSCSKEDKVIEEPVDNTVTVKGKINNTDTKSDYTIDNGTAYFHWSGTETIGRLNYYSSPSFWEDSYTSTTSADNKETELVFSGTPSYSGSYQTDYAMYPVWNNSNKTGIGWGSSPFQLYLHESMAYNSASPLKDVVPMIAKLDASGDFDFVPVTGVIAVTVKNLPSTANKITLSSTDNALSGFYLLTSTPANYASNIEWVMNNGLTTGLAYNAGNTTGTKSFTFSGLDKSSHVFYFPVSVATSAYDKYNGMTITIYAGDTVLQTVTTTQTITVNRGEIVAFPEMDLAKATKVKLTGNANAAYLYVDTFGPDATNVKFAVAATESAASSAVASGTSITATGESNKQNIYSGLTDSGKYYLAYTVYDSSNNALRSEVKTVYYLNDTDEDILCGDYTFTAIKALTINNRSAWTDLNSNNATYVNEGYTDAHMVIEPSSDITKGTIMLSNFLDFGKDGVSNKSITEEKLITNSNSTVNFQGTYSAGQPLYGTFRASDYVIEIQGTNPLFVLDGTNYYLRNVQAQYNYFNFDTTYDATTVTLTYGSASGLCIVSANQILSSGSYLGSTSTVIFGNVKPVATRTR